jgi:hypothetical protein
MATSRAFLFLPNLALPDSAQMERDTAETKKGTVLETEKVMVLPDTTLLGITIPLIKLFWRWRHM